MRLQTTLPWRCRDVVFPVGRRTLVMGILNVTPDSFSDGGSYLDFDQAVARGLQMVEQGADLIDVGGESTRPGAESVTAGEEARRVVPVIRALRERTDRVISVDTMKASVAGAALEAGAGVVNDVSALTADPAMPGVVAAARSGVILMHMQGRPRTMQEDPRYDDVVEDVAVYLQGRLEEMTRAGLDPDTIAIDPGIGFGKTVAHNISLLAGLGRIRRIGRPLVIGLSRKSFLGRITGCGVGERLPASLAGAAYAISRGADVIRVHDVKESCEVARLMDILRQEKRHDIAP